MPLTISGFHVKLKLSKISTIMEKQPLESKKANDLEIISTKDKLVLLPFYHQLENDIKQPDRIRIQTDYFWRKWASQLGPTLTVLIITLRSYCYYNKITKEKRDWCYPEQKTLAKNIGVSVDTIQRELRREIAQKFIQRKPQYRYDPAGKRKIRTTDMYYIAMDDPLTAEDEAKIAKFAAERQSNLEISPKPQNAAYELEPVDNSAIKPQIAVQKATADSQSRTSTDKNDLITFNNNSTKQLTGEQVSLVEEIISICDDEHSRNYYTKIVAEYPTGVIWQALGSVKDTAAMGKLRKSKGALFAAIMNAHRAKLEMPT